MLAMLASCNFTCPHLGTQYQGFAMYPLRHHNRLQRAPQKRGHKFGGPSSGPGEKAIAKGHRVLSLGQERPRTQTFKRLVRKEHDTFHK